MIYGERKQQRDENSREMKTAEEKMRGKKRETETH